MDHPSNNIWGPPLWRILHALTEKIGTFHSRFKYEEEKRLWITLLNSIKLSLPCPLCKNHYTTYYNSNPVHKIIANCNTSILLKTTIREWLFNLHSNVNIRLNKSIKITINDLHDMYSNYTNWMNDIHIISEQMKKGTYNHSITREDMMRTIKFIREMVAFYSI